MNAKSTRTPEHEAAAVAWARRGDFRPGQHHGGPAAQADTRALLEAAGVDTAAVEQRVGPGRPRLQPGEATERWTIRTTRQLAVDAREHAAREGRPVAELVRDAVTEYLATHQAV
ncbi:MAG: hypothetical protein FWF02_05375 [Micrococcales bacterium]|nr:hypothetical protein [Micrococcales bacterium]MCL2667123.1 hypothetical protein [Micrococcales bacterium]